MRANIYYPRSQDLIDDLLREERVIRYLRPLGRKLTETYEHSIRVGLLCVDLGHDNHLDEEDLQYLGYAGLLHDIGKINIPQGILQKDMPLDDEEKAIMQEHPRQGFLALYDFEPNIVPKIMVAHHEFSKHPYPRKERTNGNNKNGQNSVRRNKNGKVKFLAQIVAIADMYDALVNLRPYKTPLSKNQTEDILRHEFTGDVKYINQVLLRYKM
jgi:putative nucleotidyltransferase with HDIG domain